MLVATDAAGEGLNLQRAHLMVNYDLPWNPNRIEQRFGRIHRIGQTEVCHLWNLVAADTREGMVFTQLLLQDRGAGQGLPRQGLRRPRRGLRGPAAAGTCSSRPSATATTRRSRRDCTRSSTPPSARAWTSSSPTGPRTPTCSPSPTWRSGGPGWTRRTAAACPRTSSASGSPTRSGNSAAACPSASRAATRSATCPREIRDRDRQAGTAPAPVLEKYERVTFDKNLTRVEGRPRADLLAPGHPLLDAVTDLIIERHGTLLKQGTMLKDEHDPGTEPRLLVAVTHEITDGHQPAHTVAKKFGFVEVDSAGANARRGGAVPRLQPLDESERMVAAPLREAPWLASGVENVALAWAVTEGMPAELARTRDLVTARVAQVRRLVKQRLDGEINYWDMRAHRAPRPAGRGPVAEAEAGDRPGPRPRPGTPPGASGSRNSPGTRN